MGKYLSTFDTLADYEAATSELGYPNVSLIKADGSILYAKNAPTPPHSICYEIIPETIGSYTATTYDSVYSVTDAKWYMLNNLNEYEEYGVYDFVEDIASATTYEGKLAVVDTTEYQYSGDSWSIVGSYVDSSVTYTIDDTNPSPYVGQELSTTFKILYADVESIVESIGLVELNIGGNGGGYLDIRLDTGGMAQYQYMDGDFYNGTVTNDGEYFYLSLPSEAPQSIVIEDINYHNLTPIHLIVGSKQVTVEYVEKEAPSYSIYNTVQEMEAVSCPNVGVNEYAFVGNDLYKYFANEEWSGVTYYEPKMIALYENEDPLIVYNNNNGELTQGEAQANGTSFITAYIGDNVTSIGEGAFNGCSSLTSIDIPSGVTSIGEGAFNGCSSLTSIDIPSGVISIGVQAFYYCSSLTSIDIPSGVTSIGNNAFSNCSSLTSIDIPSSVTSIGGSAFSNCSSLTSIDIPSGVTSISTTAFISCSSLTSIYIPSGVTSIGEGAFNGCSSLTSIDLPNSVTSIDANAFRSCSGLRSINIPSGVTRIGYETFRNCSGLTSITVEATTPPTLGSSVFNNTNNCPIYVPSESVNAYKAASGWSTYASRIQAIL